MKKTQTIDPVWEKKYSQGHSQKYPWDAVVSFIFRNYPRSKPRHEIRVLEVGCGTGSNLWFVAREGFQVAGIDGSPSAVNFLKQRFAEEGLTGDIRVGNFLELPFASDTFDLVIDRAAITCCGRSAAKQAIAEVQRVLQVGGKFYFNPYSDSHSSYRSGKTGPDDVTLDISEGSLQKTGQICFYGKRDVEQLFDQGWQLLSLQHLELTEQIEPKYLVHAEWRVIVEKAV
jgi:ubiquinone/menaquinone biosynthesis C-methylase UbiE